LARRVRDQGKAATAAKTTPKDDAHMNRRLSTFVARTRALAITGFAAASSMAPAQASAATAGALPSGEALFTQQCGTCHAVSAGETRVGPSLYHVVGRPAGKLPGFSYSDALQHSGFEWTPAELDRWLTDTSAAVPGSMMNFREPNSAKRQAIIAYLVSISKK
jgi:cytochrome c